MGTLSGNYYGGIVKNGLVLMLDAAKKDSYDRLGTTWRDISFNGNNGTLTNFGSQTKWNSNNGGSIIFDGTDDRVIGFPTQISGNGSKTVNVFFKTTTSTRNGLCGTRDSTNIVGWAFTVNRTSSGNLSYFHTGGSLLEVSAGIQTSLWYNACVTYDLTTATTVLYLNGVRIGSLSSFTTITTSTFNGVVGDEDGSFSTPFKGNISTLHIYNRALTDSEVLQNYNATKNRYNNTWPDTYIWSDTNTWQDQPL